jgi:predicted nicotinamide N-methyase
MIKSEVNMSHKNLNNKTLQLRIPITTCLTSIPTTTSTSPSVSTKDVTIDLDGDLDPPRRHQQQHEQLLQQSPLHLLDTKEIQSIPTSTPTPTTSSPNLNDTNDNKNTTPHNSFWDVKLKQLNDEGTPLESVGCQIWNGAFLLADWLLSHPRMQHNHEIRSGGDDDGGWHVIEIGAGIGLTSLVAASTGWPRSVWSTDYHCDVLALLATNITTNPIPTPSLLSSMVKMSPRAAGCPIHVRMLDLMVANDHCPLVHMLKHRHTIDNSATIVPLRTPTSSSSSSSWNWNGSEYDLIWPRRSPGRRQCSSLMILCADIVYDEELNLALVHKLSSIINCINASKIGDVRSDNTLATRSTCSSNAPLQLCTCRIRIIMSIEKRIIFTLAAMRPVAHFYDHFIDLLHQHSLRFTTLFDASNPSSIPPLPQHFDYDRNNMTIIEIKGVTS